jgi:hypothetical protein
MTSLPKTGLFIGSPLLGDKFPPQKRSWELGTSNFLLEIATGGDGVFGGGLRNNNLFSLTLTTVSRPSGIII